MQYTATGEYENLKAVIAAFPDIMLLVDEAGIYKEVYAEGKEHLLFAPPSSFLGKSAHDIFDAAQADIFLDAVTKVIRTASALRLEYPLEIEGKTLFFEARIVPVEYDGAAHALVIVREITDIKMRERFSKEQLLFMVNHDNLTGLPNRALLFDRLKHAIAAIKRNSRRGVLLFMDIDHFKDINDNFGHHIGDRTLVEAAARLNAAVRKSDTVGRLGGDEFLVIAEEIDGIDNIVAFVQKIKERFKHPFVIDDTAFDATLSIGVALIPDDGEDAEGLVNAADQAMYTVKHRGGNDVEFYSKALSVASHEYFRIQRALRQAIRQEALTVVYQPQFSIMDGRLTGAEALVRCTLDALRDVPVEKLISIAEESGTIYELGAFVFRTVCAQITQWRTLSLTPLRVSVNLSRRELGSADLLERLRESMMSCGIEPCEVEFEITESTLIRSNNEARNNIEALRALGCRFSIDDFGTGYSSLSNLKEFDVDKLKIDKSFIEVLDNDSDDQVIVSATISMAKALGLMVLAEGVETEAQVERLKAFGCDEVQGFLYSRPVTAERMTELLQTLNA